jgi:hypothetical protein
MKTSPRTVANVGEPHRAKPGAAAATLDPHLGR